MADVIELNEAAPRLIGDGIVITPDDILEGAKTRYARVVVVGVDANGEPEIASSHGTAEALWLLEKAIHWLMTKA